MKPLFFSVRLLVLAGGLSACLLGLSACEDEEKYHDNTAMLRPEDQTSSVPWNKQQSWENNSQLGALARDPRIGGSQ